MCSSFEIRQIRLRKLISAYPHCSIITLGTFTLLQLCVSFEIHDCNQRLFSLKRKGLIFQDMLRIDQLQSKFLNPLTCQIEYPGFFLAFTNHLHIIRYSLDEMENANGTALPEYNMMFKCKAWKFLETKNKKHSFLLVGYIRNTIIMQVKPFQTH